MKIDFENLGGIDKGSIELNDFTIFCGKNNSGKTYAMYSIYGLLNSNFNIAFDCIKPVVDKLKQDGIYHLDIADFINRHKIEIIKQIEEVFNGYLGKLFGVPDILFSNTKVNFNFDDIDLDNIVNFEPFSAQDRILPDTPQVSVVTIKDKEIKVTLNDQNMDYRKLELFLSAILQLIFFSKHSSFLLPAERDGMNLLYKELFSVRNYALQQAQNDNINPMVLLKDIIGARYSEPVKDYLQFLNTVSSSKNDISDYQKYAKEIQSKVLGGQYDVDDFGNVYFILANSNNILPLHFTSSTVKTLFGLVFYLQHLAKSGDYLMIDEPELNLHPDNQRQLARILAQLVNAGLKVIVSTHSDYFVRELNNLIMLKKGFSGAKELQQEYGYQDNELLDDKSVSAYLFDNRTITPMDLNEEGIVAETFNDVINKMNQSSNKIYYAMQDAKELESW